MRRRINLFDYIFPNECPFCLKENEKGICEKCYKKLDKYKRIKRYKMTKNTRFAYVYRDALRTVFLDYKFNEKSYLYKTFSELILKNKNLCSILKNYDIITPVPISKNKYKKRGYNQSSLIAKEISKKLDLRYVEILQKVKDNNTQSLLSKKERIDNVKNSYEIKEHIANKKIVLFDDIYTTGATVNECKKVLMKNGYKDILIFCLFRD